MNASIPTLAMQRDRFEAPLPSGSFEILVFADNCSDGSLDAVRAMAAASPHPIDVVEPGERGAAKAEYRLDHLSSACIGVTAELPAGL